MSEMGCSTAEVLCMSAQRLLSDPEAAIAVSPNERPLLAEMRRSRTAGVDPKLPFTIGGANGSFLIAKRPSFDELSRPRI